MRDRTRVYHIRGGCLSGKTDDIGSVCVAAILFLFISSAANRRDELKVFRGFINKNRNKLAIEDVCIVVEFDYKILYRFRASDKVNNLWGLCGTASVYQNMLAPILVQNIFYFETTRYIYINS